MIIPSHRHHLQGEKTFGIHCERGWGLAECVVAHLEQTVKIVMMVHDHWSMSVISTVTFPRLGEQSWSIAVMVSRGPTSPSPTWSARWWGTAWGNPSIYNQLLNQNPIPPSTPHPTTTPTSASSKLCELIHTSTLYSSFSHSGGNSFSSLTLTWISLLRGKMVILCF